jgi:hypothetical protein
MKIAPELLNILQENKRDIAPRIELLHEHFELDESTDSSCIDNHPFHNPFLYLHYFLVNKYSIWSIDLLQFILMPNDETEKEKYMISLFAEVGYKYKTGKKPKWFNFSLSKKPTFNFLDYRSISNSYHYSKLPKHIKNLKLIELCHFEVVQRFFSTQFNTSNDKHNMLEGVYKIMTIDRAFDYNLFSYSKYSLQGIASYLFDRIGICIDHKKLRCNISKFTTLLYDMIRDRFLIISDPNSDYENLILEFDKKLTKLQKLYGNSQNLNNSEQFPLIDYNKNTKGLLHDEESYTNEKTDNTKYKSNADYHLNDEMSNKGRYHTKNNNNNNTERLSKSKKRTCTYIRTNGLKCKNPSSPNRNYCHVKSHSDRK